MTFKKTIRRLLLMDLELIAGLGLLGISLYGLISQNMYISLEGVYYGDIKYMLIQMLNGAMFFGAIALVIVGLGITIDALERMYIVVQHGIRD